VTVTSAVAARVLDALGDAFRKHAGPVLDPLVDALAAPIADTDDRLVDTERGWAAAFDLDQTPDPAWLGAAIGSPVPPGLTVEQARTYIRDRPYWRRGTPAAIKAAAASLLAGFTRVDLIERDGSPWRLTLRVYAPGVPAGVSEADIAAAVAPQKPVGIVLTVEIVGGASFAHMTAGHGPTFADYASAFPTFADARDHLPEEGTIG
jgi:hypothetical protein